MLLLGIFGTNSFANKEGSCEAAMEVKLAVLMIITVRPSPIIVYVATYDI